VIYSVSQQLCVIGWQYFVVTCL